MTAQGEKNGAQTDQMLSGIIHDGEEYYALLKRRYADQSRLHVMLTGLVVWFAAFVVLGVGVYFTISKPDVPIYLLGAFLGAVGAGVVAAVVMYTIRRRRGFKFEEFGALLDKVKGGKTSSEDGLRLMDMMHQVATVARKQRLDAAFEYGVGAFILVSVVGLNAGFGALAGVIVYLYFRFEAMREYEKEDERYEDAKKELLLNL